MAEEKLSIFTLKMGEIELANILNREYNKEQPRRLRLT